MFSIHIPSYLIVFHLCGYIGNLVRRLVVEDLGGEGLGPLGRVGGLRSGGCYM